MSRIDWRRSDFQKSIRDRGAVSTADEKERFRGDRAGRWLEKKPAQQPSNPANVSRSGHALSRKERKRRKKERQKERHAPKVNKKTAVVIPGAGDPCPRCKQPTPIREHNGVTEKHLNQPFFYSRWFVCMNPECRTTLIMPERFKAVNPVVWGGTWPEGAQ